MGYALFLGFLAIAWIGHSCRLAVTGLLTGPRCSSLVTCCRSYQFDRAYRTYSLVEGSHPLQMLRQQESRKRQGVLGVNKLAALVASLVAGALARDDQSCVLAFLIVIF